MFYGHCYFGVQKLDMVPSNSFCIFHLMSLLTLLYTPHHSQSSHKCNCKWHCSYWPCYLCPLVTQGCSSVSVLPWNEQLLHVFHICSLHFHIWHEYMAFLAGYLDVGVFFLLSLHLFSCCCWKIFLIAHFGYLHSPSTSSRCCNLLLSKCGVEQMVCALCVKVLITLYLADKLWLLSHGRYKSVWVGFLYTPMVQVLSVFGVMMVSKKGMEESSLDSSTVNWMEGSIELMCLRNSSLCYWCWITKVSSTYLFHILGGAVLLRWLCLQRLPCRYWPQ